ncbi:hypothetical protein [Streptomyces sp. NBC_00576]|uniref:hypothetical protein n=1 Tax=Streptomyces sp. NBC_00576 TaxID=2903665 RepID=UPI002E800A83|nr:hypothetical protein [Streptomyces sp. NBC_00576]WUB76554.1 hypothetical protein OG734_44535 [Streptomyces sp. NBC_00576]
MSNQARCRPNTAFVASDLLGGAIFSAAAPVLWTAGGWTAVTIASVVLSCFTLWRGGARAPGPSRCLVRSATAAGW